MLAVKSNNVCIFHVMDILLVEDEPQLADQVSRALIRAGHLVSGACDGPSALAAVIQTRFDLVLLDVNLPGYDGFEVLTRIRAAKLPVRVLMLTARSEIGDRVAGLTTVSNIEAKNFLSRSLAGH